MAVVRQRNQSVSTLPRVGDASPSMINLYALGNVFRTLGDGIEKFAPDLQQADGNAVRTR